MSYLEEVVHYLAPVRLLVVDQQARRRLKAPNRQRVFITLWQKEDCVSCLSWFGPVAISLEPGSEVLRPTHPSAAQTSDSVEHSAESVRVGEDVEQRGNRLKTRRDQEENQRPSEVHHCSDSGSNGSQSRDSTDSQRALFCLCCCRCRFLVFFFFFFGVVVL